MFEIRDIIGREIIDSQGNPTVQAQVIVENGICGIASVPAGASTGKYEAVELRDEDKERFRGKGVLRAIRNIEEVIAPKLIGQDCRKQIIIDEIMLDLDGTENKARLGANAILAVSLAVAKAGAELSKLPLYKYLGGLYSHSLPVPMFNILNGGKQASNYLTIHAFMIIPLGCDSFFKALQCGSEIFYCLKEILQENEYSTTVGDEGGFTPGITNTEEALSLIISAVKTAGYSPGVDVVIGLDVAASQLFKNNKYIIDERELSAEEMIKFYETLITKYPILSIEDPFCDEDWDSWRLFSEKTREKIQIVGGDIFGTNSERLKRGILLNIANSVIIKLNQIGTLTETFSTIQTAHNAGYTTVISHRSGETEDTFIADLAVAVNSSFIKAGSLSRGERIAKYNRLLVIEEELGEEAVYPSWKALYNIKKE